MSAFVSFITLNFDFSSVLMFYCFIICMAVFWLLWWAVFLVFILHWRRNTSHTNAWLKRYRHTRRMTDTTISAKVSDVCLSWETTQFALTVTCTVAILELKKWGGHCGAK